ncbi:spondin-1-like isoform X2 [Actinia tenebrosa]|nr:spondin-1-like isoform X2 [Actinia tenebrosa]
MTFVGKWSRLTHPRHFPGPMSSWSALIGCSHSNEYHMWRYGNLASLGVQRLGEWGSTSKLEEEMRKQGNKVLNIIKMPGLWWGVGRSVIEFRADQTHSLLSVMSRIVPSPDWYVGVDSLNLCHVNCTWKNEETVDLFPLDAGTDDGINFISVNARSNPQQPIRRIDTRLHNHPMSSFYLPDNDAIRPFAQIKIERLGVSGSCLRSNMKGPFPPKPARIDCQVSRWSSWTPCSVTCGLGKQVRGRDVIVQPMHDGIPCPNLYDYKICDLQTCDDNNNNKCLVSAWSTWSKCTGTCGIGFKVRKRTIIRQPALGNKTCPKLIKKRRCRLSPCQKDRGRASAADCVVSAWSSWSECNRQCNRGKKKRTRQILNKAKDGGRRCPRLQEKRKCLVRKCPKK